VSLARSLRLGTLATGPGNRLAARGLPPGPLHDVPRRIELTCLALGVGYAIVFLVQRAVEAAGLYSFPHPRLHALICGAVSSVSLLLAWLSRSGYVGPRRLLDVGLAYAVVVAFAISMGDNLLPLSPDLPLVSVSWLCVWIVCFPLVIPASPVRILGASLAAASTWPFAFFLGLRLGHPSPPAQIVGLNFLEPYFAAAAAVVISRIVRRLAKDVQRAREMGSYELVERLGAGGMGEVWRARHHMLARPAALKLIRPDALGIRGGVADTLVRRFEREAQATASLHSPHTIELYDFGITADGTFYYVMELLDGLNLASLVQRFGPVPPERTVHILLQTCDSLADAHHAGLIHRDIKPGNICLCRKGLKCDFVKVLDFGLVKSAWHEGGDPSLTQEGSLAGTPAFMAPELVLGKRDIDGRVDLYALACVAYFLLTGKSVFTADTAMGMALQHVQAEPVPPSRRASQPVPEGLERLILRGLEKDPEKRVPDAEAFAAELLSCGVEGCWSDAQASRWWGTHLAAADSDAADNVTSIWSQSLV